MKINYKLTSSQRKGGLAVLIGILVVTAFRYRSQILNEKRSAKTKKEVQDTVAQRTVTADTLLRVELNAADTNQLRQVKGIGKVLSKRIIAYREIIGGYTSVDQLMKLYGMSPENFLRIEEQVYVDTTSSAFLELRENGRWAKAQREKKKNFGTYSKNRSRSKWQKDNQARKEYPKRDTSFKKREIPPLQVNLNTADTTALDKVWGIGAKTARRIVEKREQLGFFHSLEQMREEVYGINDENFEKMRKQLFVEDNLKQYPHLHVNQMSYEELQAHRYVSKTMARLIVAYREEHGAIIDEEALRSIYGIKKESIDRLIPYLIF